VFYGSGNPLETSLDLFEVILRYIEYNFIEITHIKKEMMRLSRQLLRNKNWGLCGITHTFYNVHRCPRLSCVGQEVH
jgi:hypothetical protein